MYHTKTCNSQTENGWNKILSSWHITESQPQCKIIPPECQKWKELVNVETSLQTLKLRWLETATDSSID